MKETKAIIEALLFASPSPLTPGTVAEVLGMELAFARKALDELKEEYEGRGGGVRIIEVAEGYEMSTRPEFSSWISKLHGIKNRVKLSSAALQTVAIVAYRQPITRAEIEKIRGVNVDGVIKTLFELGLVRVVGRKATIGRPLLYGTTKEFLRCFGLRRLEDLPKIEEIYGEAKTYKEGAEGG
jgi:segregation and condensation protein B